MVYSIIANLAQLSLIMDPVTHERLSNSLVSSLEMETEELMYTAASLFLNLHFSSAAS